MIVGDPLGDHARNGGVRRQRQVGAMLLEAPHRQYGDGRTLAALVLGRGWVIRSSMSLASLMVSGRTRS